MIIRYSTFLIIVIPLWIIFRTVNIKSNQYKGSREIIKCEIPVNLLFIYLMYLAEMTIFPLSIGIPFERKISMVPFRTIIEFIPSLLKHGLITNSLEPQLSAGAINIVGNIIIFVPLGILIPLASRKFKDFVKAAAAGAFVSLLIEVVQLGFAEGRHFDIDDIILNTLGVVMGWCIYKLSLVLINRMDKKGIDS